MLLAQVHLPTLPHVYFPTLSISGLSSNYISGLSATLSQVYLPTLSQVENKEVHCKITAITATGRGGFALLQVTLIIPELLSPSVVLSSNTTGAEGKPETLNPKL